MAYNHTITVNNESGAVSGVLVQISTDTGLVNVIRSDSTSDLGKVTFTLDAGTYYAWCSHTPNNFTNPTTITVSAATSTTITGAAQVTATYYGSTDGANAAFYLERWFVATYAIFYGNGGSSEKHNIPNSYGVIGVAGNRGYCDGIDVGVTIPPWSGVTTYQIILGGRNNGGTLELRPSTIAIFAI